MLNKDKAEALWVIHYRRLLFYPATRTLLHDDRPPVCRYSGVVGLGKTDSVGTRRTREHVRRGDGEDRSGKREREKGGCERLVAR